MQNMKNRRPEILRIGVAAAAAVSLFFILSTPPHTAGAADNPKNQITIWRMTHVTNSLPANKMIYTLRLAVTVLENLVKVQETSAAESWIFNLDTGRFWAIQYRPQIFAEGTFEDLKKFRRQEDMEERANLENEMKSLGSLNEQARKERQKWIEQRLAFLGADPKQFKAKPTGGEVLTLLGWKAKPVEVKLGGELVGAFWLTDSIPMPASLRRFYDLMAEIDPTNWKVEALLSKVALKEDFDYGGIQRNWEVQDIIPSGISPNEFLIPTNFAKVEFPGGLVANPLH